MSRRAAEQGEAAWTNHRAAEKCEEVVVTVYKEDVLDETLRLTGAAYGVSYITGGR